ncbi:MAG TPA: hypothetical protein VF268_08615 [Gammaproteobacteria bacterium]|jgi:hypothetical protein
MNIPDDFDWLDKALADDGGHINDNGFTDNVIKRLPPHKPRRRWLHGVIFCAAISLSVAMLLWSLPAPSALPLQLAEFLYSQSLFTLGLLSVALCAAAGLLTAWLLNLDK